MDAPDSEDSEGDEDEEEFFAWLMKRFNIRQD